MNILAPKNFLELEKMLEFGVDLNKPVAIRYPRGSEEAKADQDFKEITLGKAELLKEGKDISIIAIGKMVSRAEEVAELLAARDIDAEIINVRFLKPLDKEMILKSISKTKRVITIEDNLLAGGLGAAVMNAINEALEDKTLDSSVTVKTFGYKDVFVKHGKTEELEKLHGLDAESIANSIEK